MIVTIMHMLAAFIVVVVVFPIASVDVDRIAKEMDFQALQQNIMNITFCNIEAEVKSLFNLGFLISFSLCRNFIMLTLLS